MDSDKILIDLSKICRACMTDEGEMTSVFNKTDLDDLRVVDLLQSCQFLHVSNNFNLLY